MRGFGSTRPVVAIAFAVLVFGVFLTLTALAPTASALQVGPVSPISQGIDSNWTPHNAPNQLSAVSQTTCGAGDGNWITGAKPYKSSFRLQLASLPPGALVTSVDLTLCYSDDDATIDGFETIIPFVRMGISEYKGAALHGSGSTAPVTNTQSFNVPSSGVLEVGVQDTGYLAHSRLRVYAIWAVVHYSPPPTVSLAVSLSGGTQPYELSELFDVVIDVTVSNPGLASLAVAGTFNPTVLTNFATTTTQGTCTIGLGVFTCGFSNSVQIRAKMGARVSPACDTVVDIHVSALGTVTGPNVADAHVPLTVNAGCVPATPTPTPTPSPSPTPTPTTASPTSSPSPTASTASATPTATITPSPTASVGTPTVTATPTTTPGSGGALQFHLRGMFVARD